MKKESKELYSRAIDSMFCAIEHFNRPYDRSRIEAVLIFLDRAFELLLKSVIVEKNGKIREKGKPHTIGSHEAIRKCVSDKSIFCINEEEALTIQNINLLRDAAQHYIVSVSEQQLFIHVQAGVSIFRNIIRGVFNDDLAAHFPERVMPVATKLPKNFESVIDEEFSQICLFLRPKARKRLEARAKLRSLAVLESSVSGKSAEPTEADVSRLIKRIKNGEGWISLFPELAKYQIVTEGSGMSVSIRITKVAGDPVILVPAGTPGATVVGVKRVNELDHYSIMPSQLAIKLKLSSNKCSALVKEAGLKSDEKFFKEFRNGSQRIPRFTSAALEFCHQYLKTRNIDDIWNDRNKQDSS